MITPDMIAGIMMRYVAPDGSNKRSLVSKLNKYLHFGEFAEYDDIRGYVKAYVNGEYKSYKYR